MPSLAIQISSTMTIQIEVNEGKAGQQLSLKTDMLMHTWGHSLVAAATRFVFVICGRTTCKSMAL